jgi:aminopeptidase-like protein
MLEIGQSIYRLASELFPICRSITGDGVRETLDILKREIGALEVHEVPTGTRAFDWVVPLEWNIHDAYILSPDGDKIVDFQDSNLHVVGYSPPINAVLSLDELQEHLYSLPEQPDAIPYITSYYRERWGFCLTHRKRQSLTPGEYTVVIDSELKEGSLTYGELILPGKIEEEIFFSTYICHPSMGNNELSGPTVLTHIVKWLQTIERRYTYRIIFIPETIGSLVYLSRNLGVMRERIVAGYNITCVGDDRHYSYLASRYGDTLADRVAKHVLRHMHPGFKEYSYLDRGSDERQYCSPGVDLPVASIMRTKYGEYPEYHTSLDDLELISPEGLGGAYKVIQRCIECLEANETLKVTVLGEPQLGMRGLYPTLSTKESGAQVRDMMNLLSYADGSNSLLDIAERIGVPMWNLLLVTRKLKDHDLLEAVGEEE